MVPVGCLAPVIVGGFIIAVFTLVLGVIKSSTPYTESLAEVQANHTVQQELGLPIEPGYFVTGKISTSGAAGHADITYAVSGPNGSGTVYAIADKAAGEWAFSTLELRLDKNGERIDLLSKE